MPSETFFVRTGSDGVARYTLEVPVADMGDGHRLEVHDEAGGEWPVVQGPSGVHTIRREDPVGQRRVVIRITSSSGEEADRKEIQINISTGIDPVIRERVLASLERFTSVGSPSLAEVVKEIQGLARGDEIPVVCEEYLRKDAVPERRRQSLAFLTYFARHSGAREHLADIKTVLLHALTTRESAVHVDFACTVALSTQARPHERFAFFVDLVPHVPDVRCHQFLCELRGITPSRERVRVGRLAVERLEGNQNNSTLRFQVLQILESFGCREFLPAVRDLAMEGVDQAVQLLDKWDDRESSARLLELLDMTNDAMIVSRVTAMFKKWNYREARPRIEELVPLSGEVKAKALSAALANWP